MITYVNHKWNRIYRFIKNSGSIDETLNAVIKTMNMTNIIKKYQQGGYAEIDPAVVTDSFTGKGKIKSLRRELRQSRKDGNQLMKDIKSYDYITDQSVLDDFTNRLENIKSPKILRRKIRDAKDEYRSKNFLGIGDGSGNALPSQLYRYWSRHFGHQKRNKDVETISGNGTDVIDLGRNVIRLTPDSKQKTALFNEFVESSRPSVHPAKKYQSGEIKFFGDAHNIPTDNISLYAGVEDGKFKTDSLYNFNPNTTIYPVRNVKRDLSKVHGIKVGHKERLQDWKHIRPFYQELNARTPGNIVEAQNLSILHKSYNPEAHKQYLDLAKNLELDPNYPLLNKKNRRRYKNISKRFLKNKPLNRIQANIIGNLGWVDSNYKLVDEFKLQNIFFNNNNEKEYGYVDENGKVHPISDYNAAILDNKLVFGNPQGGLFIGDFKNISKKQLDSLNSWLRRNPSWLVRPDLGSFDQYRLDNPTLEQYLKQYFENPSPSDPNVFTVGTTESNKMWE